MNNMKQDLDFALTDTGNAERLIDEYGHDFNYCEPMGGWLHWTGVRWKMDNNAIWRAAKELGKAIQREAADEEDRQTKERLWKWGRYSLTKPGMSNMVFLAGKDERVLVGADMFDSHPYLLNCVNGVVNLKTGELMKHDRQFHITKLAPVPYNPAEPCETWEEFLRKVIPNGEVREFLQRATGYSATGDVSEHAMLLLHGTGANGKSTFVEAVKDALGDYAHRTNTEMLMHKNNGGGATPDVAALKGRRFVMASESGENQRLAESLIKDLTGGDTINARKLYKESMEFQPSHKLWLSTNHRPNIRGTDEGIWRRIQYIPFTVSIPKGEQDTGLSKALRDELAGILAWIVRGAAYWHKFGLDAPREVRDATASYRDDMDRVKLFVSDECVIGSQSYHVSKAALYAEYRQWCEDGGEHAESQRKFSQRLTEKYGGDVYEDRIGRNRTRAWRGIGLRADATDTTDADFEEFPVRELIGGKS